MSKDSRSLTGYFVSLDLPWTNHGQGLRVLRPLGLLQHPARRLPQEEVPLEDEEEEDSEEQDQSSDIDVTLDRILQ